LIASKVKAKLPTDLFLEKVEDEVARG